MPWFRTDCPKIISPIFSYGYHFPAFDLSHRIYSGDVPIHIMTLIKPQVPYGSPHNYYLVVDPTFFQSPGLVKTLRETHQGDEIVRSGLINT